MNRPKGNPTVYRIDTVPGGQKRTRVEIGTIGRFDRTAIKYRLTLQADPHAFQCSATVEYWAGEWREVASIDPTPLADTYRHLDNAESIANRDSAEQMLRYELLAILELVTGAE